uniref:Uncharacterized protein n=1 Tax=Arundo donax TaxID=35708 RepID=A0A0A9H170_ARUDO
MIGHKLKCTDTILNNGCIGRMKFLEKYTGVNFSQRQQNLEKYTKGALSY